MFKTCAKRVGVQPQNTGKTFHTVHGYACGYVGLPQYVWAIHTSLTRIRTHIVHTKSAAITEKTAHISTQSTPPTTAITTFIYI